jgi:hypothetical protein
MIFLCDLSVFAVKFGYFYAKQTNGFRKRSGSLPRKWERMRKQKPSSCGIERRSSPIDRSPENIDESNRRSCQASIKEKGILEPLIVRKVDQALKLLWRAALRAAQKAGLREVPILIKEIGERESLELSVIENSCREKT